MNVFAVTSALTSLPLVQSAEINLPFTELFVSRTLVSSYDMSVRLTVLFQDHPVWDAVNDFPASEFYELSGFWPGQFTEIVDNLSLIPDRVVCAETRCVATKHVAIFLMLRHWKKGDKWEDVSRVLHHGWVWCIRIYHALFSLLSHHYRRLVQVIDYARILPSLEEWSNTMVLCTGCCPDILFLQTESTGN
jgi:hypothetical protein